MSPDKAHQKVKSAIAKGVLVRPANCQRCGAIDKKASDGRTTIHAHHADYSKPLDVEWICAKCHRKETPLPKIIGAPTFGERNGQAKLTESLVCMILQSPLSGSAIARQLGMHQSTINRVKQRVRWIAATKEGK